MNEAKIARIASSLNSIARKVLDAVPAHAIWNKAQIHAELRRVGVSCDRSLVDGCLDNLRGQGLIKEPTRGEFTRVTAKTTTHQPEEPMPTPQTPPFRPSASPAPAKKDPLSRLADAAKLLRQVADEIDAAALDAEETVQAAAKDTEKFRQLKALLGN
ncbi:hypothetical protein [Variovorax paradoxus]|uniref:hypothetical protein n=1 Tax=Variovorax paradoxus TaxID=34073 RepID=UPI001931CF03|nr:hypothetical protein INQ48_20510 [Variovorax paradoxus]